MKVVSPPAITATQSTSWGSVYFLGEGELASEMKRLNEHRKWKKGHAGFKLLGGGGIKEPWRLR
ncbi:putative feruloyl esterase [Venturia inaequalis]|nr:putative feruloyl esterase [Venturia inaequalis]